MAIEQWTATTALIFICIGLLKVTEMAISKWGKNGNGKTMFTSGDHEMIKDLHKMHDVRDDSGRLIWYGSHELVTGQKEMIKLLIKMEINQKNMVEVLRKR